MDSHHTEPQNMHEPGSSGETHSSTAQGGPSEAGTATASHTHRCEVNSIVVTTNAALCFFGARSGLFGAAEGIAAS